MIGIYLLMILISGLGVILSRNIVQSVLFLIMVFFLCSILCIYLGADFIGLLLLIVYIGAIAVLFLFVIMMLNVRILEIAITYSIYLPLALIFSFIFIFILSILYYNSLLIWEFNTIMSHINWSLLQNIKIVAIGEFLFNDYYILFIGATLLLFIAMLGIILLTVKKSNQQKSWLEKTLTKNVNWKYI